MNKLIRENESLRYRVVLENKTLHESTSQVSADNFVATLTLEQQAKVIIIPIAENGHQVLLG